MRNWTRPRKAVPNADRSLPLFEPFQDAPFAPEMVAVPAGRFRWARRRTSRNAETTKGRNMR